MMPPKDRRLGNLRTVKNASILDFYDYNRTIDTTELLDEEGNAIPWLTFPAICYLKQLDFSSKQIFEYGSGNSTLFWAARSKRVISVENDAMWVDRLQSLLPSNCTLSLASGRDYIENSRINSPHDVIVVDGGWRFDSAVEALRNIAADGLIILDNAERYPKITTLFREAGYLQVDMIGYGPSNRHTWATSFFFSRSFDAKPARAIQPAYTAGNVDSYELEPEKFDPINCPGSF